MNRGRRSSTAFDEGAADRPHRAILVAAHVSVLFATAGCAAAPGLLGASEDRDSATPLKGAEAREARGAIGEDGTAASVELCGDGDERAARMMRTEDAVKEGCGLREFDGRRARSST